MSHKIIKDIEKEFGKDFWRNIKEEFDKSIKDLELNPEDFYSLRKIEEEITESDCIKEFKKKTKYRNCYTQSWSDINDKFLKSYDTIVLFNSEKYGPIEFGYYSRTTSKQIYKFTGNSKRINLDFYTFCNYLFNKGVKGVNLDDLKEELESIKEELTGVYSEIELNTIYMSLINKADIYSSDKEELKKEYLVEV